MGPEADPTSPVPGMHIWGWMSPLELTWLMGEAVAMDSALEIGCLHGRSAFALLTACVGPVYCVDPWNDEADHGYPSFISSCGHFPNLRPVRGFSPAAVEDLPPVDMAFIDGDHNYEAVLQDIDVCLPRTRRLICGHDYQNADGGYPGVERAVRERFGGRVEVAEGTAIWYVRLDR